MEFYRPDRTLPISVTGRSCELNCAHCGGRYLKGMAPAREALERLGLRGRDGRGGPGGANRYSSCLVSGGCDRAGRVPVLMERELLAALKESGVRLNFHTGLVNEEEAAAIGALADHVSFDLVGDDETVREVFGCAARAADYFESYEILSRYAPVTPHVCVGLRGGRLSGERHAIEYLAARSHTRAGEPARVVFIVFTPTRGTLYEYRTPPDPADVAGLIAEAGAALPRTKINLGCMRPGGAYREALDVMCIDAGVAGIVNPTPAAERHARRLGLDVVVKRECCVL